MTYTIKWNPTAAHFLNRLPNGIALRIVKKLKQVKSNPFRFVEHYEGGSGFKLRFGDYRALLDLDVSAKILTVRVLDKRGRIYKRRWA